MQHSEKKNISKYDVPTVKDRVFNRFMLEHSLQAGIIKDNHPEYQFTPLEQAGVMGRLARVDEQHGFEYVSLKIGDAIKIMSEKQSTDAARGIQAFVDLKELFDWLYAYGPKPVDTL